MVMVGSVLESRSKVEREGREAEREVEKAQQSLWEKREPSGKTAADKSGQPMCGGP